MGKTLVEDTFRRVLETAVLDRLHALGLQDEVTETRSVDTSITIVTPFKITHKKTLFVSFCLDF